MEGVKMYFDPRGEWQKKLLDGSYDSFLFNRIMGLSPQGKTICDIGTHVGFHSLYFARLVGRSGKVFAFEPNQKNAERIKLNFSENKDLEKIVTLHPIALSIKNGTEELILNTDVESGRSSGSFIDSADTIWERNAFEKRGFVKTKVEIKSFDSFGIKPNILKIDGEGAEFLVLRGARKTIMECKPVIFVEIHSMLNMFDVVSFLKDHSYKPEIIHKEPDGRCFIEAKPK